MNILSKSSNAPFSSPNNALLGDEAETGSPSLVRELVVDVESLVGDSSTTDVVARTLGKVQGNGDQVPQSDRYHQHCRGAYKEKSSLYPR